MSSKSCLSKARGAPARDFVLVVGAAHIDVIADYASAGHHAADVDKTGVMRYSVGGTAYNIAINLGEAGIPVALMTVLRPNTYPSVWIRERLDTAGVYGGFIDFDARKPDSGFVAIRRDRELETAVTATAVESHSFAVEKIEQAIAAARIVVFDCNLAPDQIGLIVSRASAAGKVLVCAAVSDSKVSKLVHRYGKPVPIDIVVLNERELTAAGWAASMPPSTPREATDVCTLMGAKRVVLTRGINGHVVLASGGEVMSFAAPVIAQARIRSSTGAGDALLAGIVTYWYRRSNLDFADMAPDVSAAIGKVLSEEGATRGSIASEADLTLVTRWLARHRTFAERWITTDTIGIALTAATVAIAVPAWLFPRAPATDPPAPKAVGAATSSASQAVSGLGPVSDPGR